MKLFGVALVRNEIDIINGFVSLNRNLLDGLLIADMNSSDGTREVLDQFAAKDPSIKIYSLPYFAKAQAETVTALSKHAFMNLGADWVFFLDADEFVYAKDRADLKAKMAAFGGEVMHLPWMNLMPTEYGTFSHFKVSQDYYWSGKVSQYRKVAISCHFALSHPNYTIDYGSHNVRPDLNFEDAPEHLGLPLLHLPIRSVERLRYKAANALKLLNVAFNAGRDGSHHYGMIQSRIDGETVDQTLLNGLAEDYGATQEPRRVDPVAEGYQTLTLSLSEADKVATPDMSSIELRQLDDAKTWKPIVVPSRSALFADLEDEIVTLRPQPIRGNEGAGPRRFAALKARAAEETKSLGFKDITDALKASMIPQPVNVVSAWTDLVPILGVLFATLKPRRFVELGVHNGMSFFSACNLSDSFELATECIGIDSWEGDIHAGAHTPQTLLQFRETLKQKYPDQIFIQAYFDDAQTLFDDGSIDLLHIDGCHSHEAVRNDFETWTCKMSPSGVIILHDTNVHNRDFGVWQFWAEIRQHYPHIEVFHGYGLGILYVGGGDPRISQLFDYAMRNSGEICEAISFLEVQASRFAEQRKVQELLAQTAMAPQKTTEAEVELTRQLNAVLKSRWWRMTEIPRRWSNRLRKAQGRPKKYWPKPSD